MMRELKKKCPVRYKHNRLTIINQFQIVEVSDIRGTFVPDVNEG